MDKWQALNTFWNSFSIPAYDENTVPDDAQMPYITYYASVAGFEEPMSLNGSIWYHTNQWTNASKKADEIAEYIGTSYKAIKIDDGYMVVTKGSPFAQRLADDDDSIRRIYILINVEFCTEV